MPLRNQGPACLKSQSHNKEMRYGSIRVSTDVVRRWSYGKGGVTHPTINARFACVDHGAPGLMAGGGIQVRWWLGDEEEQGEHAGAEDGEVLDDVEVGEHSSLAVELAVDIGHGGMGTGALEGVSSSSVSSEEGLELGDLIDEGLVSGGEAADHCVL